MAELHKEAMIGRLGSGKRIAQIILKVKDVPGSAATLAESIPGMGAVVRQSAFFSVPEDGYAIYNAFVELMDGDLTGEKLAVALAKSPSVLEAKSAEGTDFGALDTLSFPLLWGGKRIVYMNQRAIAGVFQGIQTTFGSGGDFILFQAGNLYGREMEDSLIRSVGRDALLKTFGYTISLIGASGWGVPSITDVDTEKMMGAITVTRCFECEGTKADRPACSFVRGVFVGAVESLLGGKVQCEETRCIARGDPSCRFEFSRTP